MSSEASSRKKRAPVDTVKRSSEDDHRRKRRNRMTQSCLNCHTSKRMCDRKRPCGRCTQLGLTGLCVYEVDDPNQRNDVSDEQSRLQKRVAELESVIRELKNKPHPRWVQSGSGPDDMCPRSKSTSPASPSFYPIRADGSPAPESNAGSSTSVQLHPPTIMTVGSPSSPPLSNCSTASSPSPVHTPPSPFSLTPIDGYHPMTQHSLGMNAGCDLASLLSSCYAESSGLEGIFDGLMGPDGIPLADPYAMQHHINSHHLGGHCGCLNDSKSYNVVLELSLRLRRAAEILNSSPKHLNTTDCSIHQRIAALDRLTTEALGNIDSSSAFPSYTRDHPTQTILSDSSFQSNMRSSGRHASAVPTISPQLLHGVRPWDFQPSTPYPSPPSEDSFMSWDPLQRRGTDSWPQSGHR